MRATDAAAPLIPAHAIPADQPSAMWPAAPVVGLEWVPQSSWNSPDPLSVWDGAGLIWDDPASAVGYTDIWCDTQGIEIVHGEPDDADLYPPSRCTLTLYDPTGRYRRRTVDGQLVYYAPGRSLVILANFDAGDRWWLFWGRVATWTERAADDTIEIVAYGAPSTLAQDPGRVWTAGTSGDTLRPRVTAILAGAGAGFVTARSDLGDVTLSVPDPDRMTGWEMIQRAAWSDGGIAYSDADDTLIVRDRRWRQGRADTPSPPLVLTDNVCVAGNVVVWEPEIANVDDWLAGRVVLSNAAAAPATLFAYASNPAEMVNPALIYSHPDTDLWRTQAEGDALAASIANDHGAPRMALDFARVYLHDPRRQSVADWRPLIDLRLGDRIGWQHQSTNVDDTVTLVDVDVIVDTVRHNITPETWLVEIESSPAVGYRVVWEWDTTTLLWDTADPTGVWR